MTSGRADQPLFVDFINVSGDRIEKPTWADFASLEFRLQDGMFLSFSLQRQSDRDAGLEVNVSETAGCFVIVGMEDSKERGTFAFCYLDSTKTSKPVSASGDYYPEYCTTNSASTVVAVARTYFQSGELDRSVSWHVSRRGTGRKLEDIPPSEILRASDTKETFRDMLSRL
jgi:hypothetical protein